MKTRTLSLFLALVALTPLPALAADAPASAPAASAAADKQVYGAQLMTPEERQAYRMKMRSAKTPEERAKIRADHHAAMQARAKEKGLTLPDMPPAGGGGMGPGMGGGMGGGMGPGMGAGRGMGPGGGAGRAAQ